MTSNNIVLAITLGIVWVKVKVKAKEAFYLNVKVKPNY